MKRSVPGTLSKKIGKFGGNHKWGATREIIESGPSWPLKLRPCGVYTNEWGHSMVGSLDLSCRYTRFLSCLGFSSQPSTKYFFPHCILFTFCVSIAQQLGQAVVPGRLSLNMCRWVRHSHTRLTPSNVGFFRHSVCSPNDDFKQSNFPLYGLISYKETKP